MDERKISMSGPELVSLAASLAICIAEKYEKEDLHKLRLFFATVASNIGIIEGEGKHRFR